MTLLILATAFAGFSRSYYLRPWFFPTPLSALLRWHGILFTSWLVLLLVQTALVAAGRTRLHRRLGVAGAVMALAILAMGTYTAIVSAREAIEAGGGSQPLSFLVVPLGDMLLFAGLIGGGLHYRKRVDVHKRLILLGCISMLPAAIGRLPLDILSGGQPVVYALLDLYLVPCVIHDLIALRRVHPATGWGSLAIVASQPLRLMLANTGAWLAFAGWLVR